MWKLVDFQIPADLRKFRPDGSVFVSGLAAQYINECEIPVLSTWGGLQIPRNSGLH